MPGQIALRDVLSLIEDKEVVFDISFATWDKKKKKGGKLIKLKDCVACGQKHNMKKSGTIGVRTTRNSHHPYAVHKSLITEFNKKRVFY